MYGFFFIKNDIKDNKVYTLDEVFAKIENIYKVRVVIYMKKYIVEMSETAEQDLERYDLCEDIIADKYKILFKQKLQELGDIAII